MKIKINKYGACTSRACCFRRACAQHDTAGEFRNEDGFTPELEHFDNDIFYCKTADRNLDEHLSRQYYECMPEGYGELGYGMLTKDDLKRTSVSDYQI